jgi:hypothetical protein
VRNMKHKARVAALVMWRKAYSNWLFHRTDEAAIVEHAARHHYLLFL